jgi:D-alanyl-D-alanine dipeptidase
MIEQGLVNVKSLDPSIAVLLKYSTTDNFVKKDVYGCMTACYLQKSQLKCWQEPTPF